MTGLDAAMKRGLDVFVTSCAMVLLAPALLLIAVVIRIDSPGPVLYRGRRVGAGGRHFAMLKFRTMVVGADRLGGPSTANGDPRVTRVGRILRKYKADELPQLINVLTGDMSLVGPRPEVPQYVAMFTQQELQILEVKPGITDLATLWNSDEGAVLAGADDPERMYLEVIRPRKIQLQLEYVRSRSFASDLRIIWQTLMVVAGRGNHPI
jgi:lipopolysaccharide/colanic/teichoic acid biosynthesis glycosyltransferase